MKRDTLEFIYEHTKGSPESQLHDADSYDTKGLQLLGIASVVLGLTGFAIGLNDLCYLVAIPLVIAVLAYVKVVWNSYQLLKTMAFRKSTQADVLWPNYWDEDIEVIKHGLTNDISEAYAHNKKILKLKADAISRILIALGVEVTSIGIFILASLLVV